MSSDFFTRLQLETICTPAEERRRNNNTVQFFKQHPDYLSNLRLFSQLRPSLSVQTLQNADAFYIPEFFYLPDETNISSHFCGRFVYPVKDVSGDVAGWCGYDCETPPKYLDSVNVGYKAKHTMLYGMEQIPQYYRSDKTVFITEGIVCSLLLRQYGFHALALLGSFLSPYFIQILLRFGDKLIILPDSDESGTKLARQATKVLPKARALQSSVAKDVEDTRNIIGDSKLKDALLDISHNFFSLNNLFRGQYYGK